MKPVALLLLLFAALASGTVTPLPRCPGDLASPVFRLEVEGVEVPVSYGEFHGGHSFHHASFEMSGEVTLRVSAPGNLTVRPARHGITPQRQGSDFIFKIREPLKLVLEAEGQRPLLLFALPLEEEVSRGGSVRYFGPGVHEAGEIRVKSGETIYLAAGALVKGRIYGLEVEDVAVRGRGVLDTRGFTSKPSKINGILFERAKNIRIGGIQLRSGEWWQCTFLLTDHVRVDHLQTLGFGVNNDGVDLDGVTDLQVRDSFIGCGDDGFGWHAVDAVSHGEPPTRDCLAERCVIWNEHAGNGLRLGASMETGLFANISFRDIDVLHVCKGGVAIMSDHADWARLENVLFERFHNESDRPLMFLSTKKNRYSNDTGYRDERGSIRNVYFKEVSTVNPGVTLEGSSTDKGIVGLYFENCSADGKPLVSAENFRMNAHVEAPRFVDRLPDRATVPLAVPTGRRLEEFVIDDGDEGFFAFGGKGLEVRSNLPGSEDGDARRLPVLGRGHAAVYTPLLEGKYEISVHWGELSGVATKAPWAVRHRSGYSTKVFDQNGTAGWHVLGTFTLDGASWVRLADPHQVISDGPVVADAVRFRAVK
jgi:hypothetical protein